VSAVRPNTDYVTCCPKDAKHRNRRWHSYDSWQRSQRIILENTSFEIPRERWPTVEQHTAKKKRSLLLLFANLFAYPGVRSGRPQKTTLRVRYIPRKLGSRTQLFIFPRTSFVSYFNGQSRVAVYTSCDVRSACRIRSYSTLEFSYSVRRAAHYGRRVRISNRRH